MEEDRLWLVLHWVYMDDVTYLTSKQIGVDEYLTLEIDDENGHNCGLEAARRWRRDGTGRERV